MGIRVIKTPIPKISSMPMSTSLLTYVGMLVAAYKMGDNTEISLESIDIRDVSFLFDPTDCLGMISPAFDMEILFTLTDSKQ
jgi:hypothetical protein